MKERGVERGIEGETYIEMDEGTEGEREGLIFSRYFRLYDH